MLTLTCILTLTSLSHAHRSDADPMTPSLPLRPRPPKTLLRLTSLRLDTPHAEGESEYLRVRTLRMRYERRWIRIRIVRETVHNLTQRVGIRKGSGSEEGAGRGMYVVLQGGRDVLAVMPLQTRWDGWKRGGWVRYADITYAGGKGEGICGHVRSSRDMCTVGKVHLVWKACGGDRGAVGRA